MSHLPIRFRHPSRASTCGPYRFLSKLDQNFTFPGGYSLEAAALPFAVDPEPVEQRAESRLGRDAAGHQGLGVQLGHGFLQLRFPPVFFDACRRVFESDFGSRR